MHQEQFSTELQGRVFSFDKDLVHTCQQPRYYREKSTERNVTTAMLEEVKCPDFMFDHPGTWPGNGFTLTFKIKGVTRKKDRPGKGNQ